MNPQTVNFIKQWLVKANEDLLVVEKLTEYEVIANGSVCFHCQQAVEKFLKAGNLPAFRLLLFINYYS